MSQVFVFEASPVFMDIAQHPEPKGPTKWKAGFVDQLYVDEFDIAFYDRSYPVVMRTCFNSPWLEFMVTVDELKFTDREVATMVVRHLNDMIVCRIPTKEGRLIDRTHPMLARGFSMTYIDSDGLGYEVDVLPNGEVDLEDEERRDELFQTCIFGNGTAPIAEVSMTTVIADIDNVANWSLAPGYRFRKKACPSFGAKDVGKEQK